MTNSSKRIAAMLAAVSVLSTMAMTTLPVYAEDATQPATQTTEYVAPTQTTSENATAATETTPAATDATSGTTTQDATEPTSGVPAETTPASTDTATTGSAPAATESLWETTEPTTEAPVDPYAYENIEDKMDEGAHGPVVKEDTINTQDIYVDKYAEISFRDESIEVPADVTNEEDIVKAQTVTRRLETGHIKVASIVWHLRQHQNGTMYIVISYELNTADLDRELTASLREQYPNCDIAPVFVRDLIEESDFDCMYDERRGDIELGSITFDGKSFDKNARWYEDEQLKLIDVPVVTVTGTDIKDSHNQHCGWTFTTKNPSMFAHIVMNRAAYLKAAFDENNEKAYKTYAGITSHDIVAIAMHTNKNYDNHLVQILDVDDGNQTIIDYAPTAEVPDIETANKKIAELMSHLSKVLDDYKKLEADKKTLEEAYNKLKESSGGTSDATTDALKKQIEEKDKTITDLNNKITELQAEIDRLKSNTSQGNTSSGNSTVSTGNTGTGSGTGSTQGSTQSGSGSGTISTGNAQSGSTSSTGNTGNTGTSGGAAVRSTGGGSGSISTDSNSGSGSGSISGGSTNPTTGGGTPKTGDKGIGAALAMLVLAAGTGVLSCKKIRPKHKDENEAE